MKIYLVGGAVRDGLMGMAGSDRDWVVVGATPQEMLALGYQPVGRDFPVFLHPQTREEYALARTERKSGPGYKGFVVHAAPEVTLEQDLARRDLTINAMAQDENGELIDPFGGAQDLKSGILRHVTDAFREDPVRILRLARFAARFSSFSVAPETLAMARDMAKSGEIDALVPERVWQEVSRGLMSTRPDRMAQVLIECDAWSRLWPELPIEGLQRQRSWSVLKDWSQADLAQRWALWCQGCSMEEVQQINQRLRTPTEVAEFSWAWGVHQNTLRSPWTDAQQACTQLHLMDAQRRPMRVFALIDLASHWADSDETHQASDKWQKALHALRSVDTKAMNQQALNLGLSGPDVGIHLMRAQTQAIANIV
jgi:tRNA nucleotidyltransferase (CCA-adding enzyme)